MQNEATLRQEIPSEDPAASPLSVRIARLVALLWEDRRITFRIIGVGFVLSIALALLRANVYTSTATLMPPDNAGSSNLLGMLANAGPVSAAGSSLLSLKTPGALFVGILNSRTVHEQVINNLDLQQRFKVHQYWQAEQKLISSSAISEDPKTGIIKISVETKDPNLSREIAQEYVKALDHVVTTNSTSQAHRERVFLEGRLAQIKQDLDTSSQALSQFSSRTKTFDVERQATGTVDAGMKLQAELESARAELASLRQAYSADNVRVKAAAARVAELQRAVNELIQRPADATSSDETSSTLPSISQLPVLGLTFADLDRRVRVQELLWEALTKQYEAAKVQEAKETPSVRILDAPEVPQRKSGPARTVMVLLGTFFFAFIAVIVVLVRSLWRSLDEADERKQVVRRIFGRLLPRPSAHSVQTSARI